MQIFSQLGMSPEQASSLIPIMGIGYDELEIPYTFNKVKDILAHFGTYKNPRLEMLRIVEKHHGSNGLDVLWSYSQLQKEKREHLNHLKPETFEPDIAEELSKKYLTLQSKKRILDDIEKRLAHKTQKQNQDEHDVLEAIKGTAVVDEEQKELEEIRDILYKVQVIDSILQKYE